MAVAGFVLSLVAGFFLLIGILPFLGWSNWFTTLPLAILGIVFSSVAVAKSRSSLATAGLVIGILVFVVAVIRLILGGGIL
jgi:hypothetical protein